MKRVFIATWGKKASYYNTFPKKTEGPFYEGELEKVEKMGKAIDQWMKLG